MPDKHVKLSSKNEGLKNTICRDGLDVLIAFEVGSKKCGPSDFEQEHLTTNGQISDGSAGTPPSVSEQENLPGNSQPDLSAIEKSQLHQSFWLKAVARRVAQFG
ncbi:MAG: hypothetical protein EOO88_46515, partial [Pedobacter sp.]